MEICIAVADWARGPMTSVLGVPGGEGTGARRRKRPRHDRRRGRRALPDHPGRKDHRTILSGSTRRAVWTVWTTRTAGQTGSGQEAGMVAGWG
ncbi:hypothetical protein FNV62_29910 [Streptomyces sp. RLB3-17]|nr:hypothetical protein FNV67_32105 [Streptomyces sp. S1D4-20]QDN69387.1 hypothetical protein FNV66_31125 [Streptomyces sp. S1D4-14]QDN79693.1 hypothetical protein FNV64_32680 [Streptomyces sp. S1A1-7]QDN89394.1 hypothetical protein FNV61_30950 [Streptomyces sp. RLB3-6]QDO00007.1 hypothetical protein FNV58_32170 [Streptomyces sp. RLB1-9]QDO10241.1 hypothetical protein FNV68_32110 [Streptomyces sp. S1D4-23]QDO21736.1 hypothetical protein FNV65_30740 [Streptomyces sp. S1A1-8]QDO31861.1 hypothe